MVNPILILAIASLIGTPVAVDELDTLPDSRFNQLEGLGEEMKVAAGLLNRTQLLNEYSREAGVMLERNNTRGLVRARERIRENIRRMENHSGVKSPELIRAEERLGEIQGRLDETPPGMVESAERLFGVKPTGRGVSN